MKIPLHNIYFFTFKSNEIILPCKKKVKDQKIPGPQLKKHYF
jgi:hypothetical protein